MDIESIPLWKVSFVAKVEASQEVEDIETPTFSIKSTHRWP
jgi:hypothetical protein